MRKGNIFLSVLTICLSILLFLPFPVQAKENTQADLLTDKEDNLSLLVSYGYDNTVKYGRYVNVTGNIQNNGEKEFTGSFECLIPKSKDNALYTEKFTVEAGKSKRVSLIIPIIDDTGYLQVKLLNKKKKEVLEHKFRLTFGNYDKTIYAGVLTDNKEALSYLGSLNLKPFYLTADMITENYRGLDLLDVLIINDFDVSKLSSGQTEAIKEWVYGGGTLVLTAGAYDKEIKAVFGQDFGVTIGSRKEQENISFLTSGNDLKVLKQYILDYQKGRRLFYQELIERNSQKLSDSNTNLLSEAVNLYPEYGLEEWSEEEIAALKTQTVTKQIAGISLDNGINLVRENKSTLMLCSKKRYGKVELIAFDIGLDKKQQTMGLSIIRQIAENISEIKRNQLDNEYYGWYMNDGQISNIASLKYKKVPATYMYIIIILLYLFLSGPLTYLCLRRKKKQGYGLLAVSVLSVIFALIIFITGTGTRITKPYADYLRIKDYTQAGMDRIEVALRMPNNYDYALNLTRRFPLTEISDANPYAHNYGMKQAFVNYNNVKKVIQFDSSGVKLQVTDNTAFSPVYFQGDFKTEEQKGKLLCKLSHTGDGISGTIQNNLDYTISTAILLCDEHLINIGEIKKGETITLKNVSGYYLNSIDDLYDTSLIKDLTGLQEEGKNRNENIRLNLLIRNVIENNYSQGCFTDCLISYKQFNIQNREGEGDEFLSQLASLMQVAGTEIIKIPVAVNKQSEEKEFVCSIDPYIQLEGSSMGTYYTSRYMVNDSMLLSYQFPEKEKIESFTFLKNQNLKGNSKYTQNFNGTVYFLNVDTGKYEEVFTDNYDTEIDASKYLTDNNVLTVRFRQENAIQNYQVVLPHISYWKEAGQSVNNK
ncbi:hypothetical protein [Anaerocolumna xylanovorans]|uniref:Uncharacterized protein n=1 Tax=Anaerocolumna xylanovorans DSM 12503 TaxID=1121345 RepID=A0A1M7Y4C3_9FIRM|nr:hypothetical protein [Anaerocolumna xylanovorans]SHO47147.1 hypothetical protein SAMN02745217_01442 [Anaerocolumna xylanovorans DSM 12503]